MNVLVGVRRQVRAVMTSAGRTNLSQSKMFALSMLQWLREWQRRLTVQTFNALVMRFPLVQLAVGEFNVEETEHWTVRT